MDGALEKPAKAGAEGASAEARISQAKGQRGFERLHILCIALSFV